jgi:hypothetical protein
MVCEWNSNCDFDARWDDPIFKETGGYRRRISYSEGAKGKLEAAGETVKGYTIPQLLSSLSLFFHLLLIKPL